MEILDLIDKLEALASSSRKLPLTGKAMVRPDQLTELVDQMRLAVPRGIQEAQEVLDRREEIITQSLTDAKRVRTAAEMESRSRVEEGELVKMAKTRADEITEAAAAKGRKLMDRIQTEMENRRSRADEYAKEVLVNLEAEVSTLLHTVRRGLSSVTPKAEPDPVAAEEAPA
jgi:cell division septum initiation protein DivIVA